MLTYKRSSAFSAANMLLVYPQETDGLNSGLEAHAHGMFITSAMSSLRRVVHRRAARFRQYPPSFQDAHSQGCACGPTKPTQWCFLRKIRYSRKWYRKSDDTNQAIDAFEESSCLWNMAFPYHLSLDGEFTTPLKIPPRCNHGGRFVCIAHAWRCHRQELFCTH